MAVYIDTRWIGEHGIGRFATEVIARLTTHWTPLGKDGSPSAPADYFRKANVKRDDLIFSPGYNVSRGVTRQLITVHDLIHLHDQAESSLPKRVYYDRIIKPAVRRSGIVLTVSQASADALSDWLRDPSVDIRVVGNGCSAVFTRTGPEDPDVRGTFLFVGNARPHKNFAVIVGALRIRPDYRLTVVSRDRESLQMIATEAGVVDQIDFRSGLNDEELASAYRSSIGLLMPSTLEGFGLPALESICCGTNVAYWAGCPSVAEIVEDHGIDVKDAASPQQWAAAMDWLVSAESTAPTSEWFDRYSWDRVAQGVDDAFTVVNS